MSDAGDFKITPNSLKITLEPKLAPKTPQETSFMAGNSDGVTEVDINNRDPFANQKLKKEGSKKEQITTVKASGTAFGGKEVLIIGETSDKDQKKYEVEIKEITVKGKVERSWSLEPPLLAKVNDGKFDNDSIKHMEDAVNKMIIKGPVKGKTFNQKITAHPLQSDAKLEPALDKLEAAVMVAKNGDPALQQVAKLTANTQGNTLSIPAKPSSRELS